MEYLIWVSAAIIGVLITAALIHFGAVIIGPSDRGFGAAFMSATMLYIVGHVIMLPLYVYFGHTFHAWIGGVIWAIISIAIIKRVYETAWGSALMIWVVAAIVNAVYMLLFYGPVLINAVSQSVVARELRPMV